MQFPTAERALVAILELVYPVGTVYVSADDVDPTAKFGFGVWVEFAQGRVLVGRDTGQVEFDVTGETGGAKTVTLTAAQMPSHTHVQDPHNHTQNAHSHAEQLQGNTTALTTGTHLMGSSATGGTLRTAGQSTLAATATNNATTAVNQTAGGDLPHPNLPPYVVVRYWQRTG